MSHVSGSACLKIEAPVAPTPILRLVPGGRQKCFAEQLVELRPSLRSRALMLTKNRDDAEDLVGDTLLRALHFESSFQSGTNLKAWSHQVMFSVFVTNFRKSKRDKKGVASLSADPCAWTHPDAAPQMQSVSPGLQRTLQTLPDNFRDVLLLVDVDELPYKDAAQELGIPVGTVMSRLFRARKLLASKLTA